MRKQTEQRKVQVQNSSVNTLYTNTQYNDKIRYNDNLFIMKPSLKRWQLMTIMQEYRNKTATYILDIC